MVKKLRVTLPAIFCSILLYGQPYNFYYGNLHSHTGYSDGNQDSLTSGHSTPAQDFSYAKQSFHMDFLGISDHNHFQAGMETPAAYHAGVSQATAANVDGSFAALYGMEWGVISNGGHLLLYGIDSLIGWDKQADGITNDYDIFCAKSDYASLWNIVNARPGSFCLLAHPQTTDYNNIAGSSFNTAANLSISGCAFRSGSAFSTTTNYTDPAPTSYEIYYKQLLSKGYHAGPTLDADNHNTTFGRTHKGRTVVLASSLTRANILTALRNRRFYASDDWNAQVTFTVSGNYMGSDIMLAGNSVINVSVTDPDAGDNVASIQIFYGVPGSGNSPTVLTSNSSSSSISYTHTTTVGNQFYYYARITQSDGDILNTAPVWISRTNGPLPIQGLVFTAHEQNKLARLHWRTETETDNNYFVVEKSFNGTDFFPIGYVNSLFHTTTSPSDYDFTDSSTVDGTQFYRLQQVDLPGRNTYSVIVAVTIHKPVLELISLFPNPAHHDLSLRFLSFASGDAQCLIYTEEGRQVMQSHFSYTEGVNHQHVDISHLPAGFYIIVLRQPGHQILETKFVKQ